MSKHIQLRGKVWFARLSVPAHLRSVYGKSELLKSLKTSDKRIAEARAMSLVGKWKEEFEGYVRKPLNSLDAEAIEVRQAESGSVDRDTGMSDKDYYIDAVADKLEGGKKERWLSITTAQSTPFAILLDRFMDQWSANAKTKAMARTAIARVAGQLKTIETATPRAVTYLLEQDHSAPATKRKNFGFVSQYWQYLERLELTGNARNPFANLSFKNKKRIEKVERQPFAVVQLENIYRTAESEGDAQLANLIKMAAYTGARIEELCSLKLVNIFDVEGELCFTINDAKTKAGNRTVPVHPKLKKLVETLSKDSADGFLFSGLTSNKYDKRSDALGKRFGRLKKSLGYGEEHVFHSIRKTVITIFENSEIKEGVVADIVGHEKNTMTYGLYSGGHNIEKKLAALKVLRYKF